MPSSTSSPKTRRYDLDWLRLLLILTVFIFHSSRFFDGGDWHVKNAMSYRGVDIFITFLGSWLMPLIFIVSGASLFYALGKGSSAPAGGQRMPKFLGFAKDKVLRLAVPLVAGAFTHVMWQVYLERTTHGQFHGSFWQFIPNYFKGWYGFGGNFAWMGLHLWYLLMLFVFSLALYPVFLWLRGSARRGLDAVTRVLAAPGAMYLLAVPTILTVDFLSPDSLLGRRDWGGWSLVAHLWFFIAGFAIISSEPLQARIKQWRWVSTGLGVLAVAGLLVINSTYGDAAWGRADWPLFWSVMGLGAWAWMLAWLGHAMTGLNFNKPFLRYANEAVLPFYVMHQTVLLTVGYFVVRWPVADLAKFFIIAISGFAIVMALYEFAIRRVNLLRFLFGMKPRLPQPSASATPVRPLKPAARV